MEVLNFVVILDYRGIIWKDNNALLRHEKYARKLYEMYGQMLVILTCSTKKVIYPTNQKYLKIFNLGNKRFLNFEYLINSRKFINEFRKNCKLLIAGDPWESALIALFINWRKKEKIPLQIQVHGDIANKSWKKLNWKNRFRSLITSYTLVRATRIRCVGESQANSIHNMYRITKFKIDVIEVPMDLHINRNYEKVFQKNGIGFLGRISEDRGINIFVELIYKIAHVRDDFNVVVAGDGRFRKEFERDLVKILGSQRVTFLGEIESNKLDVFWNQIAVLASTAPSESFGRSIREAIIRGKPVWAVQSSGVMDLMLELEKEELMLLDSSLSPERLSSQFQKLLFSNVSTSSRDRLCSKNDTSISRLIESWKMTQKMEV